MAGTSTRLSSVVRLEVDGSVRVTVMSRQPHFKIGLSHNPGHDVFQATVKCNLTYMKNYYVRLANMEWLLRKKQFLALDYSRKQSNLSSKCIWILTQSLKNTGVRNGTSTLPPDVNLSTWFAAVKWNREGLCSVPNHFLLVSIFCSHTFHFPWSLPSVSPTKKNEGMVELQW